MPKIKLKKAVYWLLLFFIVAGTAELVGYAGLWYKSRQFDFLGNNHYFQIRAMLLDQQDPDLFPRYLTLPYLGYVPYPGYQKHNIVQHNKDGYRGHRIPLALSHNLRVLCLGGSTTYGSGVDLPGQTYPAQLENILSQQIKTSAVLSKRFAGAEVINAGLEAGTSAEELEQYLLKYRYYQPDIVIVHSGINDAELVARQGNDMQPDYTDTKRILFHLNPLQGPGKYFMHSYFVSFIAIWLFYEYDYERGTEFTRRSGQKYCKWSSINMDTVIARGNWSFYPFYRNTKTLFKQISDDGAMLIVMPTIVNPKITPPSSKYSQITSLNAQLSKQLCDSVAGLLLPFRYDSISRADSWVDDCHVNAAGELQKAAMVARFILKFAPGDSLLKH